MRKSPYGFTGPSSLPLALRVERRFNVKDMVGVSKESLPMYPEAMRLGWVLGVMEDNGDVRYEVAVSLPNTEGRYWSYQATR